MTSPDSRAEWFIVQTVVDKNGVVHDEGITLEEASNEALWYAVYRGDQNAANELAMRVAKQLEDSDDPDKLRKEMQE
ncbi:MAG TPA: hypothetical protein VIU87_19280 [Mycobacterium sp.]